MKMWFAKAGEAPILFHSLWWVVLLVHGFGVLGNSRIDVFTTADGLIHQDITALYQDAAGYLWVGTSGGVCRFNGEVFDDLSRYNPIPSEAILGITGDDDGRVWVFERQRVYRFERQGVSLEADESDLGDQEIRVFLVDRKRRVWLGTKDGLLLIANGGKTVMSESNGLPGTSANFIYQSRDDGIWVGFRRGGLARYDEATGGWTSYTQREGLPSDTVNGITETSAGRIWVATHGGLAFLHGSRFSFAPFNDQLPNPVVYKVVEGNENELWFNGLGTGAFKWDGVELTVFTEDDTLVSNYITDIQRDHRGMMWLLSAQGVTVVGEKGGLNINQLSGLSSDQVNCFYQSRQGLIWLGTGQGLNRYQEARFKTELYDESETPIFPLSGIRSIFTDRHGHLWFPSYKGIGYYNGHSFRLFTTLDGLPSGEVHAFREDGLGRIWAGTTQGIAIYDGDHFVEVVDPLIQGNNVANLVSDHANGMWILLRPQRLVRFDPTGTAPFRSVDLMEETDRVVEIHPVPNGEVWIRTTTRLIHYRDADRRRIIPFNELVGDAVINHAYLDEHGIWWLAANSGLFRYDGKTTDLITNPVNLSVMRIMPGHAGRLWLCMLESVPNSDRRFAYFSLLDQGRLIHFEETRSTSTRAFLEGVDVRSDLGRVMVEPNGTAWLLSGKGLTRFKDYKLKHWGVAGGLAGNHPRKVLRTADDALWVGTNGGLNKIHNDIVAVFSTNDGLLDQDIRDLALDPAGYLWVRTKKGVQRYFENRQPPRVELTEVQSGDATLPLTSGQKLRHDQNDLVFQVSSVDLQPGSSGLQFLYTLRSADREWTDVTRERKLRFPSLRPGSYHFEIRAYNQDLLPSENHAVYEFTILRPIWFRPWFIVCVLLFLLTVGYLVNRYRLKTSLEKARIVNELMTAHDMQMNLMPTSAPNLEDLDIAGRCLPAREVGGDYYDYFWMDEKQQDQLGFAILDVSGKSMEAAIIAVLASGLVHGEVGGNPEPAKMLTKINYPMYKKTSSKSFTTGLVCTICRTSLKLVLANAGHMDPILIRGGAWLPFEPLPSRDLPLGAVKSWQYRQRELQLQTGDLLLLYTDGLSEAMNEAREIYGEKRLTAFLEGRAAGSVQELVDDLLGEVAAFAGTMPQHDDITLIAIRVK